MLIWNGYVISAILYPCMICEIMQIMQSDIGSIFFF